ncbi:MAG: MarR family transcriptional regulator [Nocardioidaceae bacterium]
MNPPESEHAHTENLMGALALVIADRTADAIEDSSRQSPTAAAALSALHQFLGTPSIDLLRQVLGLTSSGTVRLVDRLEDPGYVTRRTGSDGRLTLIQLTASGRRAASRVSSARSSVLREALSVLSPDERRTLDAIAARLLVGLMRGPGAVRWMCRLCDVTACGRDQGRCPVAAAASSTETS